MTAAAQNMKEGVLPESPRKIEHYSTHPDMMQKKVPSS